MFRELFLLRRFDGSTVHLEAVRMPLGVKSLLGIVLESDRLWPVRRFRL
jgi:hypothetical protein